MILLGAKYGKFKIDKFLHSRTAISNHVDSLFKQAIAEYTVLLTQADANQSWCLITDGWTDKINKNSYVDYSFSIIDSDFKPQNFQFSMEVFEDKKNATNIENSILQFLTNIPLLS